MRHLIWKCPISLQETTTTLLPFLAAAKKKKKEKEEVLREHKIGVTIMRPLFECWNFRVGFQVHR